MNRIRYFAIGTAALLIFSSVHAQDGESNLVIQQFNKSISSEAEGRYADALKDMESLPEGAKHDYLVCLRLGWVTYLNQYYDLSASYYQQANEAGHNRSVEALLGLTLPLAAKNDWTRVEATYRSILKIDDRNYLANLHMGQIELNRGNYSMADRYLKIALESYPGEYQANLSAAWNDYYLGRSGEAKLLFERSLMLSPGDTSATRGIQLVR